MHKVLTIANESDLNKTTHTNIDEQHKYDEEKKIVNSQIQ